MNCSSAGLRAAHGLKNCPKHFEVDLFKKKFKVPFPLLADPQLQAVQHLNIEATPTFLILRLKADSDPTCKLIDAFEGDLGNLQQRLQQLSALVAVLE